jgi:hypothetical protein
MEWLLEVIFVELVLPLLAELFSSLGLNIFNRNAEEPLSPWQLLMAYVVLGTLLGLLSVLWFPASLLHSPVIRTLNLLLAPVVGGSLMLYLNRNRQRSPSSSIGVEEASPYSARTHFFCGFLFTAGITTLRFFFAR